MKVLGISGSLRSDSHNTALLRAAARAPARRRRARALGRPEGRAAVRRGRRRRAGAGGGRGAARRDRRRRRDPVRDAGVQPLGARAAQERARLGLAPACDEPAPEQAGRRRRREHGRVRRGLGAGRAPQGARRDRRARASTARSRSGTRTSGSTPTGGSTDEPLREQLAEVVEALVAVGARQGAARRLTFRHAPRRLRTRRPRSRSLRLPGGDAERDRVAVEEPLEIRVNGEPVAVTMRTPGHDEELALGFCLSEGIAPGRGARCPPTWPRTRSRSTRPGFDAARLRAELLHVVVVRRLRQGRARGGRRRGAARRRRPGPSRAALVASLPDRLRAGQGAFAATGGLHATGLFDRDGDAPLRPRGRRPPQRDGQGGRLGVRATDALPLADEHPLRQRPALVRARPEGGGRRLSARSSPSARRRASPSSSPPTAGSRSAASSAASRVNVYTEPWRVSG